MKAETIINEHEEHCSTHLRWINPYLQDSHPF